MMLMIPMSKSAITLTKKTNASLVYGASRGTEERSALSVLMLVQ